MAHRKQVSLDTKLITRAATALLKHFENVQNDESKQKATKNLFAEDDAIQLIITIKNVPDKSKAKPIPIPLPNPLFDESSELCLFLKDSPELKAKIKAECENMKLKIITLAKLRANYKQYEDKRKLAGSHDLFLTDDSILTFLPKVLGKTFFKKKKQPVPIAVNKGSVSKAIEAVRNSTFLYFSSGSCICVRIARTNFPVEKIVENIEQAIPEIVSKINKKWSNIQSISIKTTDSVALPFYNSLPTPVMRIEVPPSEMDDAVLEGKEEVASEQSEEKETKKKRKSESEAKSESPKKRKPETKESEKEKPEPENKKKRKVEENKTSEDKSSKQTKEEAVPKKPKKEEAVPTPSKEQKKPATPTPSTEAKKPTTPAAKEQKKEAAPTPSTKETTPKEQKKEAAPTPSTAKEQKKSAAPKEQEKETAPTPKEQKKPATPAPKEKETASKEQKKSATPKLEAEKKVQTPKAEKPVVASQSPKQATSKSPAPKKAKK